jgi:hypothetical protein
MTQLDGTSRVSTAMLEQFPGPLILRQSKFSWLVLAALPLTPLAYLVVKFWPLLASATMKGWLVFGVSIAIVWVPLAMIAAMGIARGLTRMVLDSDGFEVRTLGGTLRKRWRDVSGFSPFLMLVLYRHRSPAGGIWKWLNRDLFLLAYFGLGTKSLVRLMTEWRERALSQPWAR